MKWFIACVLVGMTAYNVIGEVQDEGGYKPHGADGKFLVAVRRTALINTGTTTTISVAASTCQNGVATTTCSGRKKRMALPKLDGVKPGNYEEEIGSSMIEDGTVISQETQDDGVAKLVIWTTSTVFYTFTSSSTQSGTTLSISYYCTAASMSTPSACG